MDSLSALRRLVLRAALGVGLTGMITFAADSGSILIGLARKDVSPSYPVRLTGYAARANFSQGTMQPLWAKALALGADKELPRVLVTVDNCGVSSRVIEEVARRLADKASLPRENLVVASSHTHSGPMVRGFAENIFVRDLTPEENAATDRYTAELTDSLEQVALRAISDLRPGQLFRASGKVGFAANRRTAGAPVAHALPILVMRDAAGKIRGVVANYACHCTTLGSEVNQCHGDWAGYAQASIENNHPGAVALITIGCGADANPSPRGGQDHGITHARNHGEALAAEVKRLIEGDLIPLRQLPTGSVRQFSLPFQTLPDRDQWEQRAKEGGIVGYHARKNLARLDRGESLPTELPYFTQAWVFPNEYAMVFLAGEVVVDYDLRLKSLFDPSKLWVTAYANDVPCYIPSRRILNEGGYEAETSLWYYDRPARLAPECEDRIIGAVTNLLPGNFRNTPTANPPAP